MQRSFLTLAVAAALAAPFAAGAHGPDGAKPSRKLLDPANIDATVKPGENFYRYANGAWLKTNPIPPTETRWGSFSELQEGNYAALLSLLEEAAKAGGAPGSMQQKVGDFYRSGMDSARIESRGLSPVLPLIREVEMIASTTDLQRVIARQHTMGIGNVFGFYVSPDDKQVTRQISQFYQGGIGMPDRDYYFKDDERSKKIRDAYKAYQLRVFQMMGLDPATAQRRADETYRIEQALAGASMTRVEQRDPYKLYNKRSIRTIQSETPGLEWKQLFADLKIAGQDSLIVGQPKFFAEVGKQMKGQSLDAWKSYLTFHLLNDLAPYLGTAYDNARFNFYGRTLRGQQEQKPRWKRVLGVVDGSVGELLGQLYVEKNFRPEAKARMLALVNNLQTTYADRIQRLDWMSDVTKRRALAKLNTFIKKIGYPDKWKDYSKLTIVKDDYLANVLAASAFEYAYNLGKLGRPVDKTEWGMTPPTVNAYYNPAFNEIVFPAGILQYPFFDMEADDAVNYGGIGGVIGHEITHGFDDQGRQYDADGNLQDWWTAEDTKRFTEKADRVVAQYNALTVLDTVHVNGQLTLGENLADFGGVAIAYEAFMKTDQAKEGEKIDGFTPQQRFFLSWAQVWRANTRDEELAARIVTDPHSPNEHRCNGPLSNMPEFYQAFGVKPGDRMYREPAQRVMIW